MFTYDRNKHFLLASLIEINGNKYDRNKRKIIGIEIFSSLIPQV